MCINVNEVNLIISFTNVNEASLIPCFGLARSYLRGNMVDITLSKRNHAQMNVNLHVHASARVRTGNTN